MTSRIQSLRNYLGVEDTYNFDNYDPYVGYQLRDDGIWVVDVDTATGIAYTSFYEEHLFSFETHPLTEEELL